MIYLSVSPAGKKSWFYMWNRDGRRREMGLGGYPIVTLARARQKVTQSRLAVEHGNLGVALIMRRYLTTS